jgi:hypothetical protein
MRQGRIAGVLDRSEASEAGLLALMFGEAVARPAPPPRGERNKGAACALELASVSTSGEGGRTPLRALSLTVRSGEIVGVAGVSGNGQRELGDLVSGLQRPAAGTKRLWGEDASRWSIARIRANGVAIIPEDALAFGAHISVALTLTWAEGMTGGRGFIAIALVIFAKWDPLWAIAGALLFGGAEGLQLQLQAAGAEVSPFIMNMLPYLLTLLVLVVWGWNRRTAAPAALGRSFVGVE